MNKVILMGRMTKDAEVRYTQGENSSAVARFTLAVDRRFKRQGDEQTADFISCVAFGKTAEFIEKYGHQAIKLTDVIDEYRGIGYQDIFNEDKINKSLRSFLISDL